MKTTENNGERAFADWIVSRGLLPQRLAPNGSPRCDYLVNVDGQNVVFEVYTFFGSTNESPGGRLISDINLRLARTVLSGVVSVRVDTDRVISIAGRSHIAGASKEITNRIVASIRGLGEEREQNEIVIPNAGSYSYRPLAGRERLCVIGTSHAQMCRSKELLREALEKKRSQYKKST